MSDRERLVAILQHDWKQEQTSAVITSAIISTLAHFIVGALKSLVTTRNWFASGLEMTVVGVVEASITYLIGLWLGAIG